MGCDIPGRARRRAAFDSANFGDRVMMPRIGAVPRNVALICQWTWACAVPPRGPNQHANHDTPVVRACTAAPAPDTRRYSLADASRPMRPCLCSCITAIAVNDLISEPTRKTVSW